MKLAILKTCLELFNLSGARAVLGPLFRGQGVIFCLHHVCPGGGLQTGFAPNSNLEVTPEFLDRTIRSFKEAGYDLISLSDVAARLHAPAKEQRPFAVFTLDDGYLDNFVHAMPIFRKHGCPFTVFVSPGIIDGTCEMWWQGLEHVIASQTHVDIELGGDRFSLPTASDAQKNVAWRLLAKPVQAMPEYSQREWLRRLCDRYGVDLKALCASSAMTWDQLREMNAHPLATIGAHTNGHYAVSKLSDADSRREIVESGERLKEELGQAVEHFAFPYGNVAHAGPRDFNFAREAGYKTAVTTRLGVIQPSHASHLHALPRVIVSGKMQKESYLQGLASGVPGFIINRFTHLHVN